MIALADGYFNTLQLNDGQLFTQFTPDCHRHENGVWTANDPHPGSNPDPNLNLSAYGRISCEAGFKLGNYPLGRRAARTTLPAGGRRERPSSDRRDCHRRTRRAGVKDFHLYPGRIRLDRAHPSKRRFRKPGLPGIWATSISSCTRGPGSLHLRRGNSPDRISGREAGLPPDQAAVPGECWTVRLPDCRQQRGDSLAAAVHCPKGRRCVPRHRDQRQFQPSSSASAGM